MVKSNYRINRTAKSGHGLAAGAGFRNLSAALDTEFARMQERIRGEMPAPVQEVSEPRLLPEQIAILADRYPAFRRIGNLLAMADTLKAAT